MKVNSEHLYNYIINLANDEKVKFKVYYDDNFVTEIYWNGESFEWDTGTFTSEAFFNPLYDFEVIEEDKKIGKLDQTLNRSDIGEDYYRYIMENRFKINEIIDYINGGTND